MHGISDYNVGNQAPNIHDPLLDRNNIDFSCPAPLHSMNAVSENALPTKDHEVISAPTRFSKFDIGVKDELRVGSVFKSKEELTKCLEVLAVNESFEFRTPRSDRGRIRYCCVDAKCCWVLRATSYNRDAGSFVVTVFVNEHNCDTSLRNFNRSQAKSKTVGELVSHYFEGGKVALKPKQIMEMFRHEGGVGMSYSKAWRAKEYAIDCARGTATNGYEDLPSWLYMVEKTNPGSVTSLKIDKDGIFKYAFLAFGASLRGFKLLRKVISIDGSHLKAKFKGTLLGVSAQDGNFNLYPLAFGIVDSETTAAWDWFLKCLKKIIPDEPDLVIVSDRAQSIASAVMSNYPLAHHGLCYFHLEKNLEIAFKCSSLIAVVKDAAYAYSRHEFDLLFAEINLAHPKLADYLRKLDISRWARAYAPSNRFNIMTSNLAECLNSLLNEPREYPIVYLFETIRCVLSRWFYERHEEGKNHRHKVTKNVGKRMTASYNSAARKFNVAPVSRSVFEVKGDKFKHIVDLDKRECTCGFFSIEKFPCSHAIAAAKKISLRENDFVDDHYLNERWILAYSETIFPVGDKAFWDIPAEVNAILCLPPFTRIPSGRPKNGRIRSAWE